MNTIQSLKITINEIMDIVPGNLIDFRIFQGTTFCHLISAAMQNKTFAFGIDTFDGLPAPTAKDMTEHKYYMHTKGLLASNEKYTQKNIHRMLKTPSNYKIIKGDIISATKELPEDSNISFALLDLYQYEPTKNALKYLWDNMNFGGCIFVLNYKNNPYSADLAIKEFIAEHEHEIDCSTQLYINDRKQDFITIRCFNENRKPKQWQKYVPVKKKLTVAMVLKTGGTYDYNYVNALANGLRAHSTVDYEIVCLTDNPQGFNNNIDKVIYFDHNYPKWWGKIELFRPDLFSDEKVFFFDLDTIIVDNIDEILKLNVEFSGLRDFYTMNSLGSGLMAWTPSPRLHKMYTDFVPNAQRIIETYSVGDQRWFDETKPSIVYLQDMFPNNIVSFKKHCLKQNKVTIPPKSKIVCFHGVPKPHNITDPEIKMHWNP